MEQTLAEKALDFSVQIVLFFEEYERTRKDLTIARHLLESATQAGAVIYAAAGGGGAAQAARNHIIDCQYWLALLERARIFEYDYAALRTRAEELRTLLARA